MTKDEKEALRVEIARIENRRNCLILEAISTVRELIVGRVGHGPYGGMADDGPTMTGMACGYLDRLRLEIVELRIENGELRMENPRENHTICPSCGSEIDEETCCCGEPIRPGYTHDNHYPRPMGCVCGYLTELKIKN